MPPTTENVVGVFRSLVDLVRCRALPARQFLEFVKFLQNDFYTALPTQRFLHSDFYTAISTQRFLHSDFYTAIPTGRFQSDHSTTDHSYTDNFCTAGIAAINICGAAADNKIFSVRSKKESVQQNYLDLIRIRIDESGSKLIQYTKMASC